MPSSGTLFDSPPATRVFPSTRYQGSKRRLAAAIVAELRGIDYTTVLDAFGGTGAVAHALKCLGRHVTYNDLLAFNHQVGIALIENDGTRVSPERVQSIGRRQPGVTYADFIERTFDGIYFPSDENRWLDTAAANVRAVDDRYERAMLWHALFQSALAKRPYNLFHRSNLAMRTADVPRTFGNKVTWERSFEEHLRRFAAAANRAVVDGGGTSNAICGDAMDVEGDFDLVYIDPPYLNARGMGVDYHHFYHFLEGLVDYANWAARIDHRYKHRPLIRQPQPWADRARVHSAFRTLFDRFRKSTLVVSYRNDGVPTPCEIASMLGEVSSHVRVITLAVRPYALSTARGTRELLFVACPP
jgi:adenine-specific DNA methylase